MEIINKLVELGIDPTTAQTINLLAEADNTSIIVGGIDTELAEKTVETISSKHTPTPQSPDNAEQFKDAIASPLKADPDFIAFGEVRNEEQAQLFMNAVTSGVKVFAPIRCSSALAAFDRLEALGIPKNATCAPTNGVSAVIYNTPVKRMCPKCSKSVAQLRLFLSEEQNQELDSLRDSVHPFIDKEKFDDLAISSGERCTHHPKNYVFTSILFLDERVQKLIEKRDVLVNGELSEEEFLMVLETYSHNALKRLLGDKLEEVHSNANVTRAKALCESGELDMMEVINKF